MQKQKSNIGLIMLFLSFLTLIACEKTTLKPSVSFKDGVQPIFTSKCISCHPSVTKPDLREGNSYKALTDGKFFNTANPTESKLYMKLMPINASHGNKIDASQLLTILSWIEKGANND